MVGDASGMGFGSSNWTQDDEIVEAEHGNWSMRVMLEASSNFREAANRIESNRIESNRIYSRNATEVNGLWKKGILYSRREVKYECLPTIPLLRRLITRGLLPFLAAFASDGPGIEKAWNGRCVEDPLRLVFGKKNDLARNRRFV